MKYFGWDDAKNAKLRAERGIGCEDIVFRIERGDLLDILKHPTADRYAGHRIIAVRREEFVSSCRSSKVNLKAIIRAGRPRSSTWVRGPTMKLDETMGPAENRHSFVAYSLSPFHRFEGGGLKRPGACQDRDSARFRGFGSWDQEGKIRGSVASFERAGAVLEHS